MTRVRVALAAVAIAVVMPPGAASAETARGLEIGVSSGWGFPDMGTSSRVGRFGRMWTSADGGVLLGARLSAASAFGRFLGAEVDGGRTAIRYEAVHFEQNPASTTALRDVSDEGWFAGVNLVASVPLLRGRVVPFATGGLALVWIGGDEPDAVQLGGGLKLYATDELGIRVEYREYRGRLVNRLDFADDLMLRLVTGGLVYRFR